MFCVSSVLVTVIALVATLALVDALALSGLYLLFVWFLIG